MATVQDYLDANTQHLLPVPAYEPWEMCCECFQPLQSHRRFRRCYQCEQMFSAAPAGLSGKTVPMTVVDNPSPWYTRLEKYKSGMAKEYAPVVASVAFSYMRHHYKRIVDLLGGAPDMVAVTPSKGRHAGMQHPLRRTLDLVKDQDLFAIKEPLQYVGKEPIKRGEYKPDAFHAEPADVAFAHVVLIEDLWVSGRTCVSAAGALLAAGAESVVMMPIARLVHMDTPAMVGPDHPFFTWVKEPFNLEHWPR